MLWKKLIGCASKAITLQVILAMKQVMDDYKERLDNLAGQGGNCGTLQPHRRRSNATSDLIDELLYNPFAVKTYYKSYEEEIKDLREWAKTGLLEHNRLANFEQEFDATHQSLDNFYQLQFGFNEHESNILAYQALTGAFVIRFAFGGYKPFKREEESILRSAIIEQRPMEEIRQYSERANLFDDPPDYRGPSPDSILNIAVGYPEALEHLISLGANPNQANDFGKTPLMYAAQHNALESGRILLEADADPNAKTIWPKNNSCFYTLRTAAMTPLHPF